MGRRTSENIAMQDESAPVEVPPSPLQGGMGLAASAGTFFLWWRTGHASDLLGALGFLVIAPAWYAVPFPFNAPLKVAMSVRRRNTPKWVPYCAGIGAMLIVASVVVRVWRDL